MIVELHDGTKGATGHCWACVHWNLKVGTSTWQGDRGKCFVNYERDGYPTRTGGADSCESFKLDVDTNLSVALHHAGYPDDLPDAP